jgi:isopenicillin N synthase-like dioxygenase
LDNQVITIPNLLEIHLQHPILFFVELIPIFVFFALNQLVNVISRKVFDIEQELALLNTKNRVIYNFIEQLRQGNTDVSFGSEFMQDRLMQALIKLRDELKKSREEEEQRKREDQQRHWINEGLAKFSAILREYVDDLQKLAEEITSNLTRYLDAKQAAFFLVKEEGGERFLDMIAFCL